MEFKEGLIAAVSGDCAKFENWTIVGEEAIRKKIKKEIGRSKRLAFVRKNEAALNGQYLLKQVLAIRIKYLF